MSQNENEARPPVVVGQINNVADLHDGRETPEMFELAPVALWLEDFSGVREVFARWRDEGVTDLVEWLTGHPERIAECSNRIRILRVNRATLRLFEANDLAHLVDNIGRVFRDDMLDTHIQELSQLWGGALAFSSNAVNYTLSGRRLDIQLKATVLPGHENTWGCVLLATEDVTERESAQRRVVQSELYARGLFEHSPISLWVEDFSSVKRLLDDLRFRGISDFRIFTSVHPEYVERCMQEIRVIDVNQATLKLFCAPDKQTLLARLGEVFRDDMRLHFNEQLIELWQGKLFQQREVVNYALDGGLLNVYLQFSVLPGHEHDWSLVLVALTDITARKKAEAYLEYLGQHDVLTKLFNRSFYVDELNRLERKGPYPVTVIIIDVNGLKRINDQLGHASGDDLLRRTGEVLSEAVDKPMHAARIGGDEFVVLLPATDERGGHAMLERIQQLVELNNQFYSGLQLSFSMGVGTAQQGERIEVAVHNADTQMYEAKQTYYSTQPAFNRRGDYPKSSS